MDSPAIEKCRNSVMVLGWMHPHFLLVHSKLREMYGESEEIGTMGITAKGAILINPKFVDSLPKDELGGVLAHEMLHLMLMHHDRQGLRDQWLWNVATDMAINNALKLDNIHLPAKALYPPSDYSGEIMAEEIYEWLKKNPGKAPAKPETIVIDGKSITQGVAAAGCGVIPDDSPGQGENWQKVAVEARAMCASIGTGTSAVATLLTPRTPKIDWRKIIKHGIMLATSRPSRDFQTFARKHRRSPAEGAQFPGWMGTDPSVAVIADASGSMDRKWIEQIAAETKNLMRKFSNISIYLCVHTSEVVWSGWISQATSFKLAEALNYSGGTCFDEAYEDVKKAGKFDCIIHFTDMEVGRWPPVPGRQLVIGAFGSGAKGGANSIAPAGARIIPCSIDGE